MTGIAFALAFCVYSHRSWHDGFDVHAIQYPELLKQRRLSEGEGFVIRLDLSVHIHVHILLYDGLNSDM